MWVALVRLIVSCNFGPSWADPTMANTQDHQMSVFASRNADAIMQRARDLHAGSIEAAPVGLREIFLQKVREN